MDETLRKAFLLHYRLPRMRRRIAEARSVIAEWLAKTDKPYVAWSTGKDSTVTLWLVLLQNPGVEAVYFDADSALPDSLELMKQLKTDWNLNLRVLQTRAILETLAEYGMHHPRIEYYTMRDTVYKPVRQLMNEGYDGVALGVRAEESWQRAWASSKYAPLWRSKTTGMWTCWPLYRWSARDVWAFIAANDLPYNTAYNKTLFQEFEKMRISYWAGESGSRDHRYRWLRHYYPRLWRKFVDAIPEVSRYA